MPFQAGDKIRNRETGEIATVTRFEPSCGNVYIGEEGKANREIAVSQWERVVEPAPREPQPVANGNGHATKVPPLSTFEREKQPIS